VSAAPRSRDRAEPGPAATDDGSKTSMAVTNRALGRKPVFGLTTDEYQSTVVTTVTRRDGTSESNSFDVTQYLSQSPQLSVKCFGRTEGPAQLSMVANMMRTFRDPRFTVTTNGPELPRQRLSLFDVMTISGRGRNSDQSGSFSMITERSNVRSIDVNDPVFSVPADFTKIT
jgi:hypothetical protein